MEVIYNDLISSLTSFLSLSTIGLWGPYNSLCAGGLSHALQNVQQHPWPLPTRCQQHHLLQLCQSKMVPYITKCCWVAKLPQLRTRDLEKIDLRKKWVMKMLNSSTQEIRKQSNAFKMLLLLLLSHVSRVQLCATPQTAAHQAPPSLGFSKNTGVGCHFLLQCMKVKSESEVAQSCQTLSDPMDCSLPGSSVHEIFQARVLEWVAVAFSTSKCQQQIIPNL